MNAYVDPTNLRFETQVPMGRVGAVPGAQFTRRGPAAWIAAALAWVAEMPRRRAVIAELRALSDRELDDIGITRADLPRLFDADFGRSAQA
jgi:uncharacterized protein YjiS (DUF1127 family)